MAFIHTDETEIKAKENASKLLQLVEVLHDMVEKGGLVFNQSHELIKSCGVEITESKF